MPATYIPPNGIVYNDVAIGTLTPVPAFAPFTRFNMATAEGKYNFFQGAGSVAADTTLRVQINQTYWNSTGTFMPMDMSVIGGPMWPLPDTPWQYPWNPYTVTDVRTADIGTGGPPVEVGLMCNVAGWDFYIQTKQSDIWNRAFGLSPGTMYCDFKDGTAGSYFDRLLVMNGPGGSYANMPPFRDSPYIACPNGPSGGPGNGLGFSNQPPPGCSTSGLCEPSHEPDLCQWAYMRFGEVQYFDYMCEWAQTSTQTVFNSSNELSSPPYPYPTWASSIYAGQYRATGWATRDVCQAAFWCSHDPSGNVSNPVFSDGSELQKYLLDQANAQTAFAIAMMDSASATLWGSQEGADYIKASGMWAPKYTASNPAGIAGMQMWQSAYTAGGIMPSALRGDPNAIDFIKRWMGFLDRIGNNTMLKGNSANAYVYHFCLGETIVIQPPGTNNQFTGQGAYPPITRDEQYGGLGSCFSTNTNAIISYVPNVNLPDTTTVVRNAFTMTINPGGVGAPTLGNGDFFFAYASEYVTGPVHPGLIPSAMTQCTVPYFVRDWTNVGGNTYSFNVATSPGGAAIPIVDTSAGGLGPMDGLWHCATPGVDNGVSNAFICQVRNTVCWIHAIGSGQATNPGHNANQFAGFT
jgi:hypothetical protein